MKRRGKKRAIVAIAPMILTAIYQMLSTGSMESKRLIQNRTLQKVAIS